MSVIIKNLTRVTQVQGKRLRNDVRLLRRICAIERFDLGIACIDNSTMRNLNSQFRFKDKTTDILSFPFLENLVAGKVPDVVDDDELNLGDIYLSMACVAERSEEEGSTMSDMITILLTHGICHLLGHEHIDEETCRLMYAHELNILQQYEALTGTALRPITAVVHDT